MWYSIYSVISFLAKCEDSLWKRARHKWTKRVTVHSINFIWNAMTGKYNIKRNFWKKKRCKYSLSNKSLEKISCKSPNNILRYYLYLKFISYLSFMVSLELLFLNFVNKTRNIFRRNKRLIWKKRKHLILISLKIVHTYNSTLQFNLFMSVSSTLRFLRAWKGIALYFIFSRILKVRKSQKQIK